MAEVSSELAAIRVMRVTHILLEARAAKAETGLEEARAEAGVHANRLSDFVDVGTGSLAHRRNSIDRRDTLREEGV